MVNLLPPPNAGAGFSIISFAEPTEWLENRIGRDETAIQSAYL